MWESGMKKILIIEDDPAVIEGIKAGLSGEPFQVVSTFDGNSGYQKILSEKPDFIILDIMLPGRDGVSICKEIRNKNISTPVLMLTAKKEEIDKVVGLEIGADDYLTKPFSIKELVARIHAVLRRGNKIPADLEEFWFGNIYLNFKKQEALRNSIPIHLSSMEFKILKYLALHKGEVISRDQLLNEVWGYESFPTTRTVDNFILTLRKKIEDDPSNPKHLLTIFKAGYKLME
jgi:DNA-binding response OmpR family regulator